MCWSYARQASRVCEGNLIVCVLQAACSILHAAWCSVLAVRSCSVQYWASSLEYTHTIKFPWQTPLACLAYDQHMEGHLTFPPWKNTLHWIYTFSFAKSNFLRKINLPSQNPLSWWDLKILPPKSKVMILSLTQSSFLHKNRLACLPCHQLLTWRPPQVTHTHTHTPAPSTLRNNSTLYRQPG